jgi:hypothetical protein
MGRLVPLDPERLEDARRKVGLTVSALARKARVRQQTVDAMRHAQRGKRKCREAIRDRLAAALDLPSHASNGSRWLGGEDVRLYRSVKLYEDGGASFSYQREANAIDLARMRLVERCRAAWERDRAQPADSGNVKRPGPFPEGARFHLLQGAVERLTDGVWWRNRLLTSSAVPPTRAEYEAQLKGLPGEQRRAIAKADGRGGRQLLWDEMSDAERADWLKWAPEPEVPSLTAEQQDRIERAAVGLLEALLEPWFTGEGQLQYERLLEIGSSRAHS